MDCGRASIWVAVAVIGAAMLVSGPIVGGIDFTRVREPIPGEGTLTASSISVPADTVRLDAGEYGSKRYVLHVPDASVSVASIVGNPIVVYKLRIPELGYVRASIHVFDENHAGVRVPLSIERDSIERSRITRDRYAGELLVVIRETNTAHTVRRTAVSVEVVG